MQRYYARVCWNSHGWVFPSGEAKRLERGSYVTRAGFGHEEWLFNFAWLINGSHYGFLQPVSDSHRKFAGKALNILLFSIDPNGRRVHVGEIKKCLVLTEPEAEEAVRRYRKSGWLNSMNSQIKAVGGNPAQLGDRALSKFNVRFLPKEVLVFQPPRRSNPSDPIHSLSRYKLISAKSVKRLKNGPEGTTEAPTKIVINRKGQPSVTFDPIERRLEGDLLRLLQRRYGRRCARRQEGHVDITFVKGRKKFLIEIKSSPDARKAIRDALGQILDYAYFKGDPRNDEVELVIVAPGPKTQETATYLHLLRTRFEIPVTYCPFSEGDQLPSVFR